MDELLKRIVIDPKVMVGKPIIKGTRLTVEHIMRELARAEHLQRSFWTCIRGLRRRMFAQPALTRLSNSRKRESLSSPSNAASCRRELRSAYRFGITSGRARLRMITISDLWSNV